MTHELELTGVRTFRYQMPLKRAYGTARGVTRAGINFLIVLTATGDGRTIEGVGECQPRHALTGDGGKNREAAWAFACAAADRLHGATMRFGDPADAVGEVRRLMGELHQLATKRADDGNRDRPFRGTLLGLEVALLDLASRALDMQLAELLGKRRDTVAVSISTISSSTKLDDVAGKVIKQKRFPITRVKGMGDLEHDLDLISRVSQANRSVGREKPIWVDINEALDLPQASHLVKDLVTRMAGGELPKLILLEGMLPKAQVTDLPILQREADDLCRSLPGGGDVDLRIMPDEGMWDVTDLDRVNAHGGCRALNIKAPKAGGLLASLDLANAAVAADPDIHICIGGMVGTSDITAWALHNLARALPRIDYLTAVPPTNVEERISTPLAAYREPGSSVIADQAGPGLGASLVLEKVVPYVESAYDATTGATTIPSAQDSTQPVAIKHNPEPSGPHTITLCGDTSLGDVHINGLGGELQHRLDARPLSFFEDLRALVSGQDALVVNLETVLAQSPQSPFDGKKRFLGWDSPERTAPALRELGVDAVGLANNHTMDFGPKHLLGTIEHLGAAGIESFGAGPHGDAAGRPLTQRLETGHGSRFVHIIGGMAVQSRLRDEFSFYADDESPGVNPLRTERIAAQIAALRAKDPTSFIIAYPHWGGNYKWTNDRQQDAAAEFGAAGADLIVGHGAHMMQECCFLERRSVIYSLGNFVFNWSGRFDKYGAPPYGLVARIGLAAAPDNNWNVDLRLYPIVSDNNVTDFKPRPVAAHEFEEVWSTLVGHDVDGTFSARASAARDSRGLHIAYAYTTQPYEQPKTRRGLALFRRRNAHH